MLLILYYNISVIILFSRNLYLHQKLLAIDLDAALPILAAANQRDLLPKGIQDAPGGRLFNWNPAAGGSQLDGVPSSYGDIYNNAPVFPTIAFLGMALVLVYFLTNVYKCRNKPRRKKPRMRKTPRLIVPFALMVAGV